MLNIFVNTWGNYNENGADGGEWVTLPMEQEELRNTLKRIAENMGDNDPEFCIHDWEWENICFRSIGENECIEDLNDFVYKLALLEDYEQREIAAAMEAYGYCFGEALDLQQSGYFMFYDGQDIDEVAEMLIDECYDLPEIARRYFDYSAFARDLRFDGYTETDYGVICEG